MAGNRVRALGRYDIRLVLQPAKNRTDWHLWRCRRRADGTDRTLLARGSLTYDVKPAEPRDVIRDLRRIAAHLERQYGPPSGEAAPEPPGGGYGGQRQLPGLEMGDWLVLHDGQALDSKPAQR